MKRLLSLLSLMLFVAVGTTTYAQGDKPSPDEIWYTTTDGKVVNPNDPEAFGSKILSNTYRNGKGVIIVEADSIVEIGKEAFCRCTNLKSITIPDSVTSIGGWAFQYCSSLTSITIPDSVTSIQGAAFYGCTSLTSVYITDIAAWCRISFGSNWANPIYLAHNLYLNGELVTDLIIPDITTIKFASFYGCSSLTSVTIPDSVTSIGWCAFKNCSSLTNFYGKFASEDGRCLIIDGVLNQFAPAGLSEYTIPDGVTSIGDSAFSGCSSLTSITIPDSVTSIGAWAFQYCSSLTSITIPDGVTSIGGGAFRGCSSLTSITIPDSVTEIGEEAFSGCIKLEQVYLSSLFPPILKENAFSGNAQNLLIYVPKEAYKLYLSMECWKPYSNLLERYQPEGAQVSATSTAREIWYTTTDGNIVKPNSGAFGSKIIYNAYFNGKGVMLVEGDCIVKIGKEAFSGCRNLKSITITDSVTSIGKCAFEGCTSLTSITIPDGVTSIGEGAFYDCISLTSITIPDSVTSIGDRAFRDCSSLTSITIPDGVTSIGDGAFSGCESLTSITIPDSVTLIGQYAFYDCTSLTSITIPDSVTSIGNRAFYGCTGELIINSQIVENNYNYDNRPSEYGWLAGAIFTSLTIGDSVTSIGEWAFGDCTSLTSITIGDSVTSIGDWAFGHCTSLSSITIPDSVTEIGDGAFYGCELLRSITIPASVTKIEGDAFRNCSSLTSINIPDSVTEIGGGAFWRCTSLTSITIPDSVTSIGECAFYGCELLRSITIPASVTKIGAFAFSYCTSLTTVYCKSTTPPKAEFVEGRDGDDSIYWSAFEDGAGGRKIYVPRSSVNAYNKSKYWSDYAYAIVGYDFK